MQRLRAALAIRHSSAAIFSRSALVPGRSSSLCLSCRLRQHIKSLSATRRAWSSLASNSNSLVKTAAQGVTRGRRYGGVLGREEGRLGARRVERGILLQGGGRVLQRRGLATRGTEGETGTEKEEELDREENDVQKDILRDVNGRAEEDLGDVDELEARHNDGEYPHPDEEELLQDPDAEKDLENPDDLDPSPKMPSPRVLCAAISDMYQRGQITRDDWRESVLTLLEGRSTQPLQGGLVTDDDNFLRTRIRRLMHAHPETGIPDGVLTEPEQAVYHGFLQELVAKGTVQDDPIVEMEEEEDIPADDEAELVLEDDDVPDDIEEEDLEMRHRRRDPNDVLAQDIQTAIDAAESTPGSTYTYSPIEADERDDEQFQRTHPLTLANRFATKPTSIQFPAETFTTPITSLLRRVANSQLTEHTLKIFGGPGLPYSPSTPVRAKTMPKLPIALDAYQSKMTEIEADVFMLAVMPGVYATVTSALVETRKRLGTAWAENLVRKAEQGELKILDAGGAGVGVLAVRDLLRAEWERMHEDRQNTDSSPTALATPDGRLGGPSATPPLGHATVLVASDALRYRASQCLDDTTFIPRLPNYIHASDTSAAVRGKFDIVIAPHSLHPIADDVLRKVHVTNLWSLTLADPEHGGVLILAEKGMARGFEAIAGAREMLLDNHIASPGQEHRNMDLHDPQQPQTPSSNQPISFPGSPHNSPKPSKSKSKSKSPSPADAILLNRAAKEPGMIIAPCTNHNRTCPMYQHPGPMKSRKDTCTFTQRFHRPPFLQRIYNASSARNFEDVQFSFLSLLRGRDPRSAEPERPIAQNHDATLAAFTGYESFSSSSAPSSLALPRAVFPPLKRHGHVILDVCTPTGSLERWTVPKSFSRHAYRDARKAVLGDLWALGAKTRIPRNVKGGVAGGAEGSFVKGKRLDEGWEARRKRVINEKKRVKRWESERGGAEGKEGRRRERVVDVERVEESA